MVWELEKNVLEKILLKFYRDKEITHLDFACGTGRILTHLAGRVKESVGIDVSPSMLEVARHNNKKNSEIIEADLTRHDVLGKRKFNLITAFRFFPNAETGLRDEAIQVLKRHLEENGHIVFNNHINNGCLKYRLARLLKYNKIKGMSCCEVEMLLRENGLKIIDVYHLCVFPSSDNHLLIPISILYKLETIFSRCQLFGDYSENIIYVCSHK